MISLSKSLAAISSLFSMLTLSAVAFAQTATEQAPSAAGTPSATPAESIAPVVPPVTPDVAPANIASDVAQQAGAIPASMLPHDLTPWGMFMQADIVVKAVMVGLAFA